MCVMVVLQRDIFRLGFSVVHFTFHFDSQDQSQIIFRLDGWPRSPTLDKQMGHCLHLCLSG